MVKSIETLSSETLILFPGSLGDFICVLPALEKLRLEAEHQRLVVAVRGQSLEIASYIPWVTQVLSLDRGLFISLFSERSTINDELGYLLSSVKHVVSWFGHASPAVQVTLERFVQGSVRSFAFFRGQENRHACQYYLRCVGSEELRCPSLSIRESEREWLATYRQSHGWHDASQLLVIHPGSGGKKKRWAAEGFVRVARWWKGTGMNKHVVVLLGPAEEHEEVAWQREAIVENSLSLSHVSALLSCADLYVGNDSGVSHLAGALGARGVIVFGPTAVKQWQPLGGALSIIANTDYRTVAPDTIGISLQEVSSEAVIAKLAWISGMR